MRLTLPFFRQENDYFCGPASLAMLFAHAGLTHSQRQLASMLKTRAGYGTRRSSLIAVAKQKGFRAVVIRHAQLSDIKRYVQKDIPVLVNYRETEDNISHFAIVTGFEYGRVLLHDPWHGKYTSLSEQDFLRRWYGKHRLTHRHWAVAIWKP